MDESNKKYESVKIPRPGQTQGDGTATALPQSQATPPISLSEGLYYEIEYDACPIPGVGKFVAKPQKIKEPEPDAIRDLFGEMREIARTHRPTHAFSRFSDWRMPQGNELVFYKQGMFMKDFTDDYEGNVSLSQYFPSYQMMGYEQLRTYFTWRTEVRQGKISETSLSYAFLYIYELLSNIGVANPQDGLDQLMVFWKTFRVYHESIDKYVLRWLKDYHIYYDLPQSFRAFVEAHDLREHYPEIASSDDDFPLFCSISKYDIRKSTFFSDDNARLIADCFRFVVDRLRQICADQGIPFDDSIFQPTKKLSVWVPFKSALFHQWVKQADRRVVMSEKEIYVCSENKWTFSTTITAESGRQLTGYVMKQMEVVLRKLRKYKFKLSANLNTVTHPLVDTLRETGSSLETVVTNAVLEFYREATKTVVSVDPGALSVIRREALVTQEKLVVPEPEVQNMPQVAYVPVATSETAEAPEGLKDVLTEIELQALVVILHGEMDLKKFADEQGTMLEVLVDGINEKAVDYMGDNLLDEDFHLYEDYKEQVKELIR